MKNFKTLLLIAVFTLGANGFANAQKIAHVDYQRVIDNMPETRALGTTLEKLGKSYQTEIEGLKKKLDAKVQKYTAEQATQTETTNKQRAQEVQVDKARFDQAQQAAYQEMQKRKGILYVFDAKSLIVKKGEDLYQAAVTKLGLLKDRPAQQTAK